MPVAHKPFILAPAGNLTSLKAAIDAGCDEIYFGVKGFNMRQNAGNFSVSDFSKIKKMCSQKHVRAFLALNITIYEHELRKAETIIQKAKESAMNAIICWDMAVAGLCEKHKMPFHLSTQASISNYAALSEAKRHYPHLQRVVLARECSLEDVRQIIKKIHHNNLNVEVETFVHGAMCVSVSGRCFMSHHLFGKSANRGECLQPCRREYEVLLLDPEEQNGLVLGKDFVMSPKDLCCLPFIEKLVDAGISSFKIEGRNRSPEYVATVVAAYRDVIDFYWKHQEDIRKKGALSKEYDTLKEKKMKSLEKVYNRGFSSAFYLG